MSIDVNAESHEVKAKYETSYNVELYKFFLNNNTVEIELDGNTFEFSTSLKNIEVIIIKTENDANNYAKTFTLNDINYYVAFYKNNKKITGGEISVNLLDSESLISIYDKEGQEISKDTSLVKLDSNDYYMTIIKKDINYIVTDINTLVMDLEEIEQQGVASVEIYNFKGKKVANSETLGTGYKVVITNNGNVTEYTVIVKGDTNGDAKINLNDVTRLYHYYKKIEKMDIVFVKAGDIAGREEINLNDITKLYHFYRGIISEL